jgi:NTP pyrophosphatase (non-canonical NTP hydrolase)
MEVRDFQALMEELYGERDRARGKEATLLWLVEEVGELSEALRRGDEAAVREEVADVMAWCLSLANILGIDVEEALEEKYPGRCSYCGGRPCGCEK